MREVQLDEETYKKAERQARDQRFESVDAYLASLVDDDARQFDAENFFTPERIAENLASLEEARTKGTRTGEQLLDKLADRSARRRQGKAV